MAKILPNNPTIEKSKKIRNFKLQTNFFTHILL